MSSIVKRLCRIFVEEATTRTKAQNKTFRLRLVNLVSNIRSPIRKRVLTDSGDQDPRDYWVSFTLILIMSFPFNLRLLLGCYYCCTFHQYVPFINFHWLGSRRV